MSKGWALKLTWKEWDDHKQAWLDALAHDPAMRGLPLLIGVVMFTRYILSEKRYSWVGADTLADELGVHERSARRALNKLVEAGWLRRQRGGRWYGDSNEHWLPRRIPADPDAYHMDADAYHKKVGVRVRKGRHPRPKKVGVHAYRVRRVHTAEEPRESRFATDSLSDPGFKSVSRKRKRRATNNLKTKFPEGWVLGNEELAVAHLICGWDLPKCEDQFDAFRDKCLGEGWTSANWLAAWKTWCRRGRDYEAKHEDEPRDGAEASFRGAQAWLNTKH